MIKAIFFDALNIEWEYEKEGYKLPLGNYLPDFWIPRFNSFSEVKPKTFTIEEYQKCFQLPKQCILLDTPYPEARSYYVTGASEEMTSYSENEKDGYGRMVFCQSQYKGRLWFLLGEDYRDYPNFKDVERASNIAKSARFEFGESGGKA